MEISKAEINELFKGAKIPVREIANHRKCYLWIPGTEPWVDLLQGSMFNNHRIETEIYDQIDISHFTLERKVKIYELFEAHIKGELTIR